MIRLGSSIWFWVAGVSVSAAQLGCSSAATEATSDDASETLGNAEQPLASPSADTAAPAAGQFCGGIAAIPCPGSGRCVDNPTDDCDPSNGGADCGGICSCIENVLCIRGSHFDSNPSVCACVPDPPACIDTVLCIRGTHFDSDPSVCACVPDQDPCAAALCQAGTICVVKDGAADCVPRRRPHQHHRH